VVKTRVGPAGSCHADVVHTVMDLYLDAQLEQAPWPMRSTDFVILSESMCVRNAGLG
jgi:hypothetical protein